MRIGVRILEWDGVVDPQNGEAVFSGEQIVDRIVADMRCFHHWPATSNLAQIHYRYVIAHLERNAHVILLLR